MGKHRRNIGRFVRELKERQVVKAFAAWVALAFFVMETVDFFGPTFGLGEGAQRFIGFLVLLALPTFVAGAWIFDVDSKGITLESNEDDRGERARSQGPVSRGRLPGWATLLGGILMATAAGVYFTDTGGFKTRFREMIRSDDAGEIETADLGEPGDSEEEEGAAADADSLAQGPGVTLRASLDEGFNIDAAPASATIPIRFSVAVDPRTLTSETVRLMDAGGRIVDAELICCSDELRLARLDPASNLTRGGSYSVAIETGVTDATGTPARAATLVFKIQPPPARRPAQPTTGTATRQPPATRPATGPGTLNVSVSPEGATPFLKVVVDGVTLGPPPIRGHPVAEDQTHRVEVVGVPDFSAYSMVVFGEDVPVTPGQTVSVTALITPFGSVDVTSRPNGLVYIDGREVGRTPLAGYPVAAGVVHTIEIMPLVDAQANFDAVTAEFQVDALEWKSLPRFTLPAREDPGR